MRTSSKIKLFSNITLYKRKTEARIFSEIYRIYKILEQALGRSKSERLREKKYKSNLREERERERDRERERE